MEPEFEAHLIKCIGMAGYAIVTQAELAALREVATTALAAYDYYWQRGMDVANDPVMVAMWQQLQAAGYLQEAR